MKRQFGAMSPRKIPMIFGSVVLYAAALAVLLILLAGEGDGEGEPVFGSMEGRFRSDITLVKDGQTHYYRENEITNYLLIGVDREDVTAASGYQHGGQADFLVVLSVDRVSRTVTPVMLDRDTMVDVQTYGVFGHPSGVREMQLCLAQSYSGVNVVGSENTAASVSNLLHGVQIAHYIVLDMSAVPLLNDAMGGVVVTLQDDFTMMDPAMEKGATLRLMGDQAEFFVRGRMTVADGTNASRMERQQQYMAGFLEQFSREIAGSEDRLTELYGVVSGHMRSDATQERLLSDLNRYMDYQWKPLVTPEGEHSIDEYGFAEFRVDEDALLDLVTDVWFD